MTRPLHSPWDPQEISEFLLDLERRARSRRRQEGKEYNRSRLAAACGVDEGKFLPWLVRGSLPSRNDEGHFRLFVSTLDEWAGAQGTARHECLAHIKAARKWEQPSLIHRLAKQFRTPTRKVLAFAGAIIVGTITTIVGTLAAASLSPSPPAKPTPSHPAKPTASHPATPATVIVSDPGAVVKEYYAAITARNYQGAWQLLSSQLKAQSGSYASFAAGYLYTRSDDVQVISVHGDVVTIDLTAHQTTGSVALYSGTYIVRNGQIVNHDIQQVS